MLGLSAFAETTFGATALVDLDITVVVTGSAVTVSQNADGITYTISGLVIPTGSAVTVSTGAADVNVLTWNAIDPDASQTWTNIDPL